MMNIKVENGLIEIESIVKSKSPNQPIIWERNSSFTKLYQLMGCPVSILKSVCNKAIRLMLQQAMNHLITNQYLHNFKMDGRLG